MATVLRYWKTFLVAAVILYVSLLREPYLTLPPIAHSDKWAHFLMYAMLGAIAWWDSMRSGMKGWCVVAIAIVLPVLYGGAIEIVQELWFYPRTGEWMDWLADAVGVMFGCGLVAFVCAIKDRI